MDARIKQEQTRILYSQAPNVFVGNVVITLCVTGLLWHNENRDLLLLWCATSATLTLIRWWLSRGYAQLNKDQQNAQYRSWALQFFVGSTVTGIMWGLLPIYFYPEDADYFAILVSTHAGYIAAAAMATSIYLPVFFGFVVSSTVLFCIGMFIHGGDSWALYPYVLAAYAIATIFFAIKNNRSVSEQILLRVENVELLADLRDQRDKAELAMLAKNRFLAAASHDLRQPVHALGLFAGSLESHLQDEQPRYILSKIKQSTAVLGELFHGLLDLSKLDANVVENNPASFDLDSLLDLIHSEFANIAAAKGLRLHVQRNTQQTALADVALVERVLRNLVSNAINYTEYGSVTLRVTDAEDEHIQLAVSDTGKGIPASEHENIFSEYHQLENPERDRQKGLGLGLAIVRRLCELMQTPISVESEPGSGATFSLVLKKGSAQQINASVANISQVIDQNLRVVFIDDEVDIVEGMDTMLTHWGCESIPATSIEMALAALQESDAPDVILADFRLRDDRSGLEAIQVIRDEFNQDIPAYLITGDTARERLQQANAAAVRILHKPVDTRHLKKILTELTPSSSAPTVVGTGN